MPQTAAAAAAGGVTFAAQLRLILKSPLSRGENARLLGGESAAVKTPTAVGGKPPLG